MDISIVIPAYNESNKISQDIEQAADFVRENNFSGEIIVVDDGSTDQTSQIAQNTKIGSSIPVEVVRLEKNYGKGRAVKEGILVSKGTYVLFADSGCCIPFDEAVRGLEMIKTGKCDIAHASRKMHGTHILKKQSLYRRICSKFFHWFVVLDLKMLADFTDTQCGFKIYKGDIAHKIYAQCVTDGFMFDIEMIVRAIQQGYVIKEFPVDWTCDRDSRLSPIRTSLRVLRELVRIKRLLGGR